MKSLPVPDLQKYIDMVIKFFEDAIEGGYGYIFIALLVLVFFVVIIMRKG
jgi:hypothetical protein